LLSGTVEVNMRITQSNIIRNYISNLRNSITNLSKSNERLSSLSKYSRVSDNTSAIARAFTIREQLYKREQHIANLEEAESELYTAEDNLQIIIKLLTTVNERSMRGINGTLEEIDRKAIAQEIDNIKGQILQAINAKFGSRYLFANSNNSEAPFSSDSDGHLLYNGVKVSDMFKDPATGTLMYKNPAYDPTAPDPGDQFLPVPHNKDIYIDIGLGLVVTQNKVDPKSALKLSTSGINVMGYGEDNLFDLLTSITDAFRNNDMSQLDEKLKKLEKAQNNVMVQITDIGSRSSYITQTKERIETEVFNLKTKQSSIESVDIEYEVINNKSYEMAWLINLQLGSQIIPPSIFDFMR